MFRTIDVTNILYTTFKLNHYSTFSLNIIFSNMSDIENNIPMIPPKSKETNKVSSSGRSIKRPKKLETTSSDDATPRKKTATKASKKVSNEVQRLKAVLATLKTPAKGKEITWPSTSNSSNVWVHSEPSSWTCSSNSFAPQSLSVYFQKLIVVKFSLFQ